MSEPSNAADFGMRLDQARIAVVGLGYVGLPLAVALGRELPTIGFDVDGVRDRKSVV